MPRSERCLINQANAERQAVRFWSDDRVELLRQMAGEGHSASSIAAAIGAGCTRNMVISKAQRIGAKLDGRARKARDHAQLHQAAMEVRMARIRARIEALQGQLNSMEGEQLIRVPRETNAEAKS